jgi:hypothetical protein
MALFYTLPVYKSSYKLVIMLFANVDNFAREYKYTVGQELKNEGLFLIKNIYRANKAADKTAAIGEARENVEMIRLFVRLMQDFKQLGLKKFVEINIGIEEVSRQLSAWEKYSKAMRAPRAGGAPPESSVARAQASVRSNSNNPLAVTGEEYCPTPGQVAQLHKKNCATNQAVILKLAGNRNNSDGSLNNRGSNGNYWSGTPNNSNAYDLNFNASNMNPADNNNRANGFSVRCIRTCKQTYD